MSLLMYQPDLKKLARKILVKMCVISMRQKVIEYLIKSSRYQQKTKIKCKALNLQRRTRSDQIKDDIIYYYSNNKR